MYDRKLRNRTLFSFWCEVDFKLAVIVILQNNIDSQIFIRIKWNTNYLLRRSLKIICSIPIILWVLTQSNQTIFKIECLFWNVYFQKMHFELPRLHWNKSYLLQIIAFGNQHHQTRHEDLSGLLEQVDLFCNIYCHRMFPMFPSPHFKYGFKGCCTIFRNATDELYFS